MSSARSTAIASVVIAALAVGGVAVARQPWRSDGDGGDAAGDRGPRSTVTATVQRTTLTSGLELTGKLGHGAASDVVGQGQGTFTKLPRPEDRIEAGEVLYELDAEPVVLFTGSRPFWRALAVGAKGPDVQELERNLTDLGYADATTLTVDEEFTDATAAAVKRWQKAHGLTKTGKVELGRVVVLPERVVRVQEVVAQRGGTAAAGSGTTVLKVTKPELFATVQLDDDQIAQLAPGSRVTVELEAGGSTRGKVGEITRGSSGGGGGQDSAAGGGGDAGAGGGGGASGGGAGGGGGSGQDKATTTIGLTDQKAAAKALADARPTVTITVPQERAENALVVPVTALVALPDGGYSVRVVRAGQPEPAVVPVRLGLIVSARAQVIGKLREGDKVVIPA